jgi:hypothetical protein
MRTGPVMARPEGADVATGATAAEAAGVATLAGLATLAAGAAANAAGATIDPIMATSVGTRRTSDHKRRWLEVCMPEDPFWSK